MVYRHDPLYRSSGVILKKSRSLWPILLVSSLALASLFFFKHRLADRADVNSSAAENLQPTKGPTLASEEALLGQIKNELEGKVGTYSVYVYDLDNGRSFGIHEKTVLTAASVAKIPILASLYYLSDRGEVDLDQTITLSQSDIQDFGSGTIRYAQPGTVYSLKTLARLMMEKSDNTAAYILGRQIIGFGKIQKLIQDWGLTQTDMENNKTSAQDMSILLTKMYKGELARDALTKEMLGFMTTSDFEDRIPLLLPKETAIYHKTGDEIGNTHDVAIIHTAKGTYFLGILALDLLNGEEEAKKAIAKVSKMVFDYQMQKH